MMKRAEVIFLPLALSLPFATALPEGKQTTRIQWDACSFNGTLPILCGNVSVPMDYTDPQGSESLVIQVVRVPAIASQTRRSILFNFGGPGGEAQRSLSSLAERLMNVTGGEHDLVAFDPRGTGTTIPFSCYENAKAANLAQWTFRDIATNASDVATGQLWAQAKMKSDLCKSGPGNRTASLIGTPFVARDFIKVVDSLGEDGKLRYWGFSYGTVLGATIAAIFPERVDRMILDAVVNVHDYYNGFELGSVEDADKLLRAFVDECIADPEYCELGRNVTGDELERKIYNLINEVKFQPVPLSSGLIDYTSLKTNIFTRLYSQFSWSLSLAPALQSLLTRNLSNSASLEGFTADPSQAPAYTEAQIGILCIDKNRRFTELETFRPVIDAIEAQSRLFGEGSAARAMRCARWDFESKEKYTGNFSVKTQQPVLIIGTTLDPITPLASAYNLSASLQGSVVLEQKGYGHSTLEQSVQLGSACSRKAIRDYFKTGKLPNPGTKCEADQKRVFRFSDAADSAV